MLHCNKCNVDITGSHSKCPLCQGSLMGSSTDNIFPYIPTTLQQHHLFLRIISFIFIVIGVISIAVNMSLPRTGHWSVVVILGLISLFIIFIVAIKRRIYVIKTILNLTVTVSIMTVLWDYYFRFTGFSVNIVLPILFPVSMITIAIVAKALRYPPEDYFIYILINSLFGLLPAIPLIFDLLKIRYPSIACVAISIITISALFIFRGKNMKSKLKKQLHI